MQRPFLIASILLLGSCLATFSSAAEGDSPIFAARKSGQSPSGLRASSKKPNIIYIMADDLGRADVGCYGQQVIQTPHIDRLAAEGRKFTQCYAGSTVCAPSRSCLMTGMHTGHTTVRNNFAKVGGVPPQGRVPLRKQDVTVAEVLKSAGYATGITGKWGLGEPDTDGVPNRQGFDQWLGYLNQRHAHTYYPEYIWTNQQKLVLQGNLDGKRGQYTHDMFTEFGLRFIEEHRDGRFFLYLSYTIPHGKYEIPSDAPYGDRPWTEKLKNYAAMVTRFDRDVGRMMALLKRLGIDRDTIVFCTSDNGPAFVESTFNSGGRLRGQKGNLYEGGIRVPMIVRWPGRIAPGSTSDQVWAFWDFLPTAADLAGVKPPQGIDGISMLPALLGKPQPGHEFLYWEFPSGGYAQAVRHGKWKAVRNKWVGPMELYDLDEDPSEANNVADKHPDVIGRIESYLKTARTDSPNWPLPKKK